MKKQLAAATVMVMAFSSALCACDKKETTDSSSRSVGVIAEADPYTEELPKADELIHEMPIPADTGTLELTEQSFDGFCFKLAMPPDVSAEQAENGVTVTDKAGRWTMSFTPFERGEYAAYRNAADLGSGLSKEYRDADKCDTEISGCSAFVSAANINDTGRSARGDERTPQLNIIIDYGGRYLGKWAGMQIKLTPSENSADENIYEYLYLRHVRALINGFSVIEDTAYPKITAGGVGAEIPLKWSPRADENSGAITSDIADDAGCGSLMISTVRTDDFKSYAEMRAKAADSEIIEMTCGDVETSGYINMTPTTTLNEDDEKKNTMTHTAELYSDMGGGYAVRTVLSLRGADEKKLNAFMNSDVFKKVISSLTADPDSVKNNTSSDSGLVCGKDGVITAYDGSGGDVVIPAEIGGITVTGIAPEVFKGSSVTSVTVPAGVTEIGSKAFSGCTQLQSITLSDGLMIIDKEAFSGCRSLSDVELPRTVTYIGCKAFNKAGKSSFSCMGEPKFESRALSDSRFNSISISGGDLTSPRIMTGCTAAKIRLGSGVESIGTECISECKKLKTLELSDGLKELGTYCFSADPELHGVTLPDGIELIPEGCFWQTTLDTLVIPESVTGIEHYAVTKAAYLVLENPSARLAIEAFNVERLYLKGIYSSEDAPRNLEGQYVAMQIFLPMDALPKESEKMDAYLNGIGFGEIAWIGTDPEFLPEDSTAFKVNDDYEITSCDESEYLYIPHCSFSDDKNKEIYGVKNGAFRSSAYKEIYINPSLEYLPVKAFEQSADLTDLWLTGAITYQLGLEGFAAGCFFGLPENVTVHIPARIPEEERSALEENLKSKGIAEKAIFDYYSL